MARGSAPSSANRVVIHIEVFDDGSEVLSAQRVTVEDLPGIGLAEAIAHLETRDPLAQTALRRAVPTIWATLTEGPAT